MPFIKMCGMMHDADLRACRDLGIQAAGIVVEYPQPVPWNLTRDQGRQLVQAAPQGLKVVMVCSGTTDFVVDLVHEVGPHVAQVHGDETLAEVASMVERLWPRGVGVYRALRIVPETGEASGEIKDPIEAARALQEIGVSAIVVDSKVPQRPGGTGVPVDLATLKEIVSAVRTPVIAAGGLTPETVASVVATVQPWGVDVLSGIEEKPGCKDLGKMQRFCDALREQSPVV